MSFLDLMNGDAGPPSNVSGSFLADMTAPGNQPALGEDPSNDPINRAAAGTYSPYEQSGFNLFVTDIGRAPTQSEVAAWAGDATRQAAWNADPAANSIGAPTALSVLITPAPATIPPSLMAASTSTRTAAALHGHGIVIAVIVAVAVYLLFKEL